MAVEDAVNVDIPIIVELVTKISTNFNAGVLGARGLSAHFEFRALSQMVA